MAKLNLRKIAVTLKDGTVPMTKDEETAAKKLKVDEFHFTKVFQVWINNAVPPSHRICNE